MTHRSVVEAVADQRVAGDIAAGRLVPVLEDWCPPFDGFSIYYPTRRQMRPALRSVNG